MKRKYFERGRRGVFILPLLENMKRRHPLTAQTVISESGLANMYIQKITIVRVNSEYGIFPME